MSLLRAQDLQLRPYLPRPYVFVGPEGMGGGYAPLAFEEGVGLRLDTKHFLADTTAWYDNAHKVNDNDQPNPSGHDRGLTGAMYYRLSSGWAFGGGARWNELVTTNYYKSAWRPTFGGSKDLIWGACGENCKPSFAMKIGVDWLTAGTDRMNGVHGPLISFYLPTPSLKGHIFYRETVGVYRFHTTVTEPSNRPLTEQQTSQRSFDRFMELTLMYRF